MPSVSTEVVGLQGSHQWPGLAAVGKIAAISRDGERTSIESRYYLMSQVSQPSVSKR